MKFFEIAMAAGGISFLGFVFYSVYKNNQQADGEKDKKEKSKTDSGGPDMVPSAGSSCVSTASDSCDSGGDSGGGDGGD